ncbi:sulfotransferase domain-containing protein [Salinivirga cyanobacteriivorans]
MKKSTFARRNYVDKLKKVVGSWASFKFYYRTYFLSKLDKIEPNVYLVSYPKCGRTWLRIMLNNYARLSGHNQKNYNDSALVDFIEGMTIKFEHGQGNWVPAPPELNSLKFNAEKFKGKRVIFLIRDPRDVLVSSWYHLKYRENIYREGLDQFIYESLTGIDKVIAFFNMWYENRDQLQDFLLLGYEGLHQHTLKNFNRIIEFTKVKYDADIAKMSVEYSSFSNMKKMEASGNLKEPWMKPGAKGQKNSMKIRKGKVGSFREELDAKDIQYLNNRIKEQLNPDLIEYLNLDLSNE